MLETETLAMIRSGIGNVYTCFSRLAPIMTALKSDRFSFFVYVLVGDVGTTRAALGLLGQLTALSRRIDSIDIYVGIDNAVGSDLCHPFGRTHWSMWKNSASNGGGGQTWIQENGGDDFLPTIAKRVTEFVKWSNEETKHLNGGRLFLVSSHGIPGLGMSGSKISWIKSDEGKELFEEADENPIDSSMFWRLLEEDQSVPKENIQQFDRFLNRWNKSPLSRGQELRIDEPLREESVTHILNASWCYQHPEAAGLMGVTYIGYSPPQQKEAASETTKRTDLENDVAPNSDYLTVRQLRLALETYENDLDCLFLHNCSLGMVETFYELRGVAKSIVAAASEIAAREPVIEVDGIPDGWTKDPTRWFNDTVLRLRGPALGEYLVHRQAVSRSNSNEDHIFVGAFGQIDGRWDQFIGGLVGSLYVLADLIEIVNDGPSVLGTEHARFQDSLTEIQEVYQSNDSLDLHSSNFSLLMKVLHGAKVGDMHILGDSMVDAIKRFQDHLLFHRSHSANSTSVVDGTIPGMNIFSPNCIESSKFEELYRPPAYGDDGKSFEFLSLVPWDRILKGLLSEVSPAPTDSQPSTNPPNTHSGL